MSDAAIGQSNSNAADLYQSGPATGNQFIRRWALVLNGANGQSWTITDSNQANAQSGGTAGAIQDPLRISFKVRSIQVHTMGILDVTVFNLPLSVKGQVAQYNEVILLAGYQNGAYGIIFKGQISWWKVGRSSPDFTETYLYIQGLDGRTPVTQATVSGNAAAGSTAKKVVDTLVSTMTELGATAGQILGIPTTPFIRGVVHFGNTIDELLTHGQVNIQSGVVNVFKPGTPFPGGTSVTINAQTGLVGMAEATQQGIEFTCLLNPNITVNSTVFIDNKDINTAQANVGLPGANATVAGAQAVQQPNRQVGWFADTSSDGYYTCWVVEHSGDSRANPWYTKVNAYTLGANAQLLLGTEVIPPANYPTSYSPALNTGPTPGQENLGNQTPILPTDPTATGTGNNP